MQWQIGNENGNEIELNLGYETGMNRGRKADGNGSGNEVCRNGMAWKPEVIPTAWCRRKMRFTCCLTFVRNVLNLYYIHL